MNTHQIIVVIALIVLAIGIILAMIIDSTNVNDKLKNNLFIISIILIGLSVFSLAGMVLYTVYVMITL